MFHCQWRANRHVHPTWGPYTLQPDREAPPNLRFEFELQGNAAKYRQSSEERQRTRETAEIASRSKMKQSTNNACTKATLKSDFLPVSCFLQATAQSKGRNSEAQQKKRAALPLMVVLLDDQRRISMMFLLIRRSMILPASTLAPSALLPNNKTTKQSRTEHATSALLF